ncbi:hypothetical protein ACQP00_21580 [Dactylosporangium sp. CS-047395]|uniref:hypothetical protein n=1 Tax=Dactylosporangium sp. CS-047395 TaxID=3239936 RepID=UPI003D8F23D0
MRTRRSVAAAAGVSVALLVAGCATSVPRRDAVADAAVRLLTAVQDRDGGTACALLAPDTAVAVQQAAGDAVCADAILQEDLPGPGAVQHVGVYGQWAEVVFDDDTVFLAALPGGWRVVAAGCRPRGERPYDCVGRGA